MLPYVYLPYVLYFSFALVISPILLYLQVESLAIQLTQREGELIQQKAEVKKLATFLKQVKLLYILKIWHFDANKSRYFKACGITFDFDDYGGAAVLYFFDFF